MSEPWIGPRQDRWTDILPESWQSAINTSPTINALVRYLNRPSFEAGVKEWQDSIPGNSPIDRIADRKSTFAQEFPQPMNPLGRSLMETGGFVANFIGPSGVRLPGRPQMTRVPETGGGNGAYTPYPEKPFVAPGATELVPGRYRVPYKDGELSYKMMDDGTANLSLYTTPEGRGRGEARRAVQSFIAAADAAKQPLSLEISPGSPGVSADRLRNFYSSLGFEGPDYYMTRQPAAPKPQGIRAYHGSPHDFDKFDISKIGTGEGAQAYGRGLYFAESEGVAKSYRDNLSKAETRYFEGPNPVQDHVLTRALQRHGPDLDATVAGIKREIAQGHPVDVEQLTPVLAEAQRLKAAGTYRAERVGDPGKMYEVRINADPETLLDWDKPLSQQSRAVDGAVDKLLSLFPADRPLDKAKLKPSDVIEMAGRGRAEEALLEYGVSGIRYKDQMSRGTDGGTSNYVVFDDKMIEILRKYGLLPPVAAGAAQALSQGQDTAY